MAKARRKRSAIRRTRRPKAGGKRVPQLSKRAIEVTLAELAHEIRTPLTGILALGELLATSGLPPREREWATAIKSTGEHLTMLTSLIVDAVRADTRGLVLRRDLVRPRTFARSLAASLDARAQSKNIGCEVTIAPDLPEVVIGDSMRLRAALENLIDNAVKFTERGTVRLEVAGEKAARDRIRLVFTVTDSGIGLSAAEIKRLFKPFAQANCAGEQDGRPPLRRLRARPELRQAHCAGDGRRPRRHQQGRRRQPL
jgi:two-component system, sensor histidine kinase